MDIDYDIVMNDEKKNVCNGFLENMKSCILNCKDITQQFSFENKVIDSFRPYDCDNIQEYTKELIRFSKISTNIVERELKANKTYSIQYDVKEKKILLENVEN